MQTVSELFEGYRRTALPAADKVYVETSRLAFYAGIAAVLTEIMNSPDDLSTQQYDDWILQLINLPDLERSRG